MEKRAPAAWLSSFFLYETSILKAAKNDEFVKSPKVPFSVIPAKAGIQSFQALLDSRLRGSDGFGDFSRDRQECQNPKAKWFGF